ncbi:MAG: hypothetical protein KF803_11290 [Cyclobacteriaceae bacterium]|nr:hypothetical protein [Cyclobacteriaceae bacterium]
MIDIYDINFDILSVLSSASEMGWRRIKEQTISRILYFSSVLYSFRHERNKNPFHMYSFSIDYTGPYFPLISYSLLFLQSNEYLNKNPEGYITLGKNIPPKSMKDDITKKAEWIKTIIYILGLYGEGKIYEFIIRDPEYRRNLETNSIKRLNTTATSSTIKFLNEFKKVFEHTLGKDSKKIDDQEYLELYFEFIFSKIVKGKV